MIRFSRLLISSASLFVILSVFGVPKLYTDNILLNSGKEIQADVIEKTDEYIILQVEGVPVKYYSDEIKQIQAKPENINELSGNKAGQPTIQLPAEKHFLWKVGSGSSRIYVLGSIHMGSAGMYPLDKTIESAFAKADVLVVEANINEQPSMQNLGMLTKALYPEGVILREEVSPDTYQKVKTELTGLNMPIELFEKYKPWFLAVTLESLKMMQLGYLPQYGIDFYFLNKAEGNKRIEELESVKYQLDILSGFSPETQEAFLLHTLKESARLTDTANAMFDAWDKGDIKKFSQIFNEEDLMANNPELRKIYQKLYLERNQNMASKIQGYSKENKTYFVVVGAGHLVGDGNILELLRKAGLSPSQM